MLTPAIAVTLSASPVALADRDDYETPSYLVVKRDGAFEVRDYPKMVVASVAMSDGSGKTNTAFMKLFRYIDGKNEAKQKIEMTTPVFNSPQEDGEAMMSFVVPKEVAREGAPKADNDEVQISERPGGRFAVYRYSGRWTEANEKAASAKLMAWAKGQGLQTVGEIERASYDPPFTIPALRRNEVMVRLAK